MRNIFNTTSGISKTVERSGSSEDASARFVVPVELCELDSFAAPERIWTATTNSLSRTKLVLMSRRMTFIGREIMVSIKLASGSTTTLLGKVNACEYHGRSMHRIEIGLIKTEPGDPAMKWSAERGRS